MLTAYDENGIQVDIFDADKKNKYFCIGCGKSMIPRQGSIRAHHFAHMKDANCPYDADGMTDWHREWQHLFGKGNYEIPTELDYSLTAFKSHIGTSSIGDLLGAGTYKKIADVLINDTVIEFQHSSISSDEVWERIAVHGHFDRRIIWVVDYRDRSDNIVEKNVGHFQWKHALHWFDDVSPEDALVEYYLQLSEDELVRIIDREHDENSYLLSETEEYSYKKFIGEVYSKNRFLDRMLQLCARRLDGSYVGLPKTNIQLSSYWPQLQCATTSNGQLISANDAIDTDEKCVCPLCNTNLISMKLWGTLPAFRHSQSSNCDFFRKFDTRWVRLWTENIPEQFVDVVVTNGVGEKHFGDIVMNGYVVKFLSEDISHDEFRTINEFYTSIFSKRANRNLKVLWITEDWKENFQARFSYASYPATRYRWYCWKQCLCGFDFAKNKNVEVFIDLDDDSYSHRYVESNGILIRRTSKRY